MLGHQLDILQNGSYQQTATVSSGLGLRSEPKFASIFFRLVSFFLCFLSFCFIFSFAFFFFRVYDGYVPGTIWLQVILDGIAQLASTVSFTYQNCRAHLEYAALVCLVSP